MSDKDRHKRYISIAKKFDSNFAEDLVQDAYIKLIEAGKSFGEINDSYMYLTIRSIFIDKIRTEKKHILYEDFNNFQIEDIIEEKEDEIEINLNEFRLNDFEKTLLLCVNGYETYNDIENQYYHFKGVSMLEISKRTGISYRTIYNNYQRAKRKIKDKI